MIEEGMNTQELLNPQQWAEHTFGDVQLHDLRRSTRAVQAASRAGGKSFGFLAGSHADLERDQSLVSEASRARCQLCGLDAAAPATDERTSPITPRRAAGAGHHRYRSVPSAQDQRRGTNR